MNPQARLTNKWTSGLGEISKAVHRYIWPLVGPSRPSSMIGGSMSFEDGTGVADILAQTLASLIPSMFGQSVTDPRDEVIVRYSKGTGRFSADKKYITLDMKQYDLAGQTDGNQLGVWHAKFSTPQELLQVPPTPTGPMNEPIGPVPHLAPVAQTKATWTFGDGSSVTVIGPATSHLIPLKDGSFIFLVSTAQVITSGTGRYEGASGVNQSLGGTFVPAGVDFFGGPSGPLASSVPFTA